ncbi:MAG: glycosyltransferase [Bacteroidales bacterium]|nr:glycosyltransferase [Bacteroidales bacterium]
MTKKTPAIFIALPVLCEHENLPAFLHNIQAQDYAGKVNLFVCVNQPDEWWDKPEKLPVCLDNARSLAMLKSLDDQHIKIIDRSSRGKGWVGRQHGVGFARREVMQAIIETANDSDVIISLDADTTFSKAYLSSVAKALKANPEATALSVTYYHHLSGNEIADRAILRYEIYMRCYAINMLLIGSPYAFTALGSAIALTVKNYKGIGGITPKMSGEDFYFLQKLRKKGPLLLWNEEKAYPAARFSDRVYFGTGPAMIKGAAGDWSSYPIYHQDWFTEIKATYDLFPTLYAQDIATPMDQFLAEAFPGEMIWEKLRKNAASVDKFIRACHEKIDGLRVLQYLKWRQRQAPVSDAESLIEFLSQHYPDENILSILPAIKEFNFSTLPLETLNMIREMLVNKEDGMLRESWEKRRK